MEVLNNDVLENILYRLPFRVASSQAKLVCKLWKTILDERRHNEVGFLFACCSYSDDYRDNKLKLYFGEEYDHFDGDKMNYYYSPETLMEHGRFSYKFYHPDVLVGSCNGLVCLINDREPFAICNPLTGEFIFLQDIINLRYEGPKLVTSGFGYCQSTKEYKVVRLYSHCYEWSSAQVYTIGSNKWRYTKDTVHHPFGGPAGVFANGVLHWLHHLSNFDESYIAAFDLEDEKFRSLPLPPPEVLEHGDDPRNGLKLLGGNLCWVQITRSCIDIWAYKRNKRNASDTRYSTGEYDHKRDYYSDKSWNWVKEYSIDTIGHGYKPFAITKSNELLLLGRNNFNCYDPKTRTISKLGDDTSMDCAHIQAIPHANSYVSLKDFGETWYGPGCSEIPKTNSYVLLTEIRDASRSRNIES